MLRKTNWKFANTLLTARFYAYFKNCFSLCLSDGNYFVVSFPHIISQTLACASPAKALKLLIASALAVAKTDTFKKMQTFQKMSEFVLA